jgi:iron complex outermembrane receptor protein
MMEAPACKSQRAVAICYTGPRREKPLLKIPNYRGSKIALGLAVAASLDLTCNFAVAQAPATEPPVSSGAVSSSHQGEELGRIVVTGYIIPRIGEGPQPVLTLDRDFMQKQGTQAVADVINRLPGNPISFNQGFATGNNGTPGVNAPQLRGLGPEATLVLVDGLRFPTHPIPINQTNAAVDINSIPLAAIDTIEVLKDGGSATYGTDAIAGVINLRLKDSYEGFDLTSYFGISQRGDGEVWHETFVTGLSKPLGSGKFSVVAAFDYYQQGAIRAQDRSLTKTDYFKFSSKYSGNASDYNNFRLGASFPASPGSNLGNFVGQTSGNDLVVPPGTTTAPTAAPGTPGGLLVNPGFLHSGTYGFYNYNPDFWLLQPRTTRIGGLIKATYDVSDWLKFYDTFIITTNHESNESPNQGVLGGPPPLDNVGGVPVNVPTTNPFNHTGEVLQLGDFATVPFREMGAWKSDAYTRVFRNTVGAIVQLPHNWFIDGSFSYGESDASNYQYNAINLIRLQQALNGQLPGLIGQFYNPFTDQKITSPNRGALDNAIRTVQWQDYRYTLTLLDLKMGGTVWDLPSGPLRVGGGYEYRGDAWITGVDENSSHFNIAQANFPGPHRNGHRYIHSLFGEVTVPILGDKWSWPGARLLDVTFSYRYDMFSYVGNAGKPKVALRYKPFDDLTFRATYAEGLVAPTLARLFGPPLLFPSGIGAATLKVNANPNLQPQNSFGYFGELVWTPDSKDDPKSWWHWLHGFSAYADWYQIEYRNQITFFTPPTILSFGTSLPPGVSVIRSPTTGRILQFVTPFTNLNRTLTAGVDIGFSYNTKEYSWGRLDIEANGTYVYQYSQRRLVSKGTDPLTGRPRLPAFQVLQNDDNFSTAPDFKGVASVFYSKTLFGIDTFRTGLTLNYVDSYSDFYTNSKGTNPRATLTFATGVDKNGIPIHPFVHQVGSWTTFDWQISYGFGAPTVPVAETPKPGFDKEGKRIIGEQAIAPPRGEGSSGGLRHWLANTTFTFGINNIWDTRAPLTILPISFGYNSDFNASPIQRFFYVQLEKKF